MGAAQQLLIALGFNPASLGNLAGWWTADYGITIGTGVSSWLDRSGNGRTLSQGTGSKQPAFGSTGPNGLPGLTFDGVDDLLATGSFTLNQPETVYMIVKQVTWTNDDYFVDGNTNNGLVIYQDTATPRINQYAGAVGGTNSNLAVNTWGVVCAVFNNASSLSRVNNTSDVTGTVGTNNAGGVVAGADGPAGANNKHSNIILSELLVYSAAHNSTQRSTVVNYLMKRAGL